MKRRKAMLQKNSLYWNLLSYSSKGLPNKAATFKMLMLGCSFLCIQSFLTAQKRNDTVGKKRVTALGLTSAMDSSRPGKEVKLVYYSVPSHLTAASTDVVYGKDLVNYPVSNIVNTLPGRLSGLYTQQGSGQPFSDGVALSLHGRGPIVIIDGVVRNLTTIDVEEIESVTLLKDAVSTAMLGVRGANGALVLTTKKGSGKQVISFTAQTGFQQALGMPKPLGSYDYALLRNEAIDNDLRVRPELAISLNPLRYTAADLQAFADKTDPYGHPDVDWQGQLFNKTAKFDRYNLNIGGGNNWSKYYVSLEHVNQKGFLKENDANKYNTNNSGKSFIARLNVQLNITPKLSGGIALFGRIVNTNEPGPGIANIYSSLLTTPNNAYPVYNLDSSFGGTSSYSNNLQGQSTGSGYLQSFSRDILTDFNLKRTLDEITPGLWIKAKFAYASNLIENYTRTKPLVVYQAQATTPLTYVQIGTKGDQLNNNSIGAQGRTTYIEFSTGYSHVFNNKHGIDVLLLANQDQSVNGSDLPYTIKGASGKMSYNYKEKYVIEAAIAANGSNRYLVDSVAGKTKYGFFPAVGAAWNISKENFAAKISWLSTLKLFASYGKSGWDNPGYYVYQQRYVNNAQAFFGTAAGGNNTLTEPSLANPGITWEKADKFNIGLDGSLFMNRLAFTAEYYNNKFYDLLMTRGQNTALLGVAYPAENVGQYRYTGWDFKLSWQESLKNGFSYFIAANAGIQDSKVLYTNEVNQPYDYMVRTGNRVGRPFGYVADGIFQSNAEIIGKAVVAGFTAQPGDIRYKDLNGDGVINQLDQTAIGTNKPLIAYGISLGFSIKSFDFSALLQGVANRDRYLSGNGYFPFQNNGLGQAYQQNLDRWTPTNTNGANPRVSIGNNSSNQVFSSFYMRSGDYIRLKNLEIGYTLPARWMAKTKVLTSARIFASGLNLLTATSVKDLDPEVFYGSYPIQRVFNFGINIKL